MMPSSLTKEMSDELNAEFEKQTGAKVDYQIQQWAGIQEKLNAALVSKTPPDVVELGNTQNAAFSSQGVLKDVTADVASLNGPQWNSALKDTGAFEGKQYGVPFYAGSRVLVYNKEMFQKAGITNPPTSRQALLEDMAKLRNANASDTNFQALYLPGQNWYLLSSLIWDEGGDLATGSGKTIKSTLDSPQAKAGLEAYKQLQAASGTKGSLDTDEAHPQQSDIFGLGHTAMMYASANDLQPLYKAHPELKDGNKLSAFPLPSKNAGKISPAFLGGSNLALPAKSAKSDLAKKYISLLNSEKYQIKLGNAEWVPGSLQDTTKLTVGDFAQAVQLTSATGKSAPSSPKWAQIEAGQNPLKDMLTAYLTGKKSLNDATSEANTALQKALQG
ncbi:extracellular solute-binding protein [Pseudonocardiaceae bacterium YIM PH 21723]|nr:extracellular solute-binding protein [Pseudonocardiaceae bacterium YIM PH 21723]